MLLISFVPSSLKRFHPTSEEYTFEHPVHWNLLEFSGGSDDLALVGQHEIDLVPTDSVNGHCAGAGILHCKKKPEKL